MMNVLVTGASSGVGLALAEGLARRGMRIIMVCKNRARGSAALESVAKVAQGAPPMLLLADLSSQAEVRNLAAIVRREVPRLDVLINNAGAAFPRRELSADGLEMTLATNHLAPFLLTNLLLDTIPRGRIVNVTSESHSAAIDFDDLQSERRYHFLRAYALSKLGNVLFTYELARRVAGTPLTANCFSPGPTATSFGRHAPGLLGVMNAMVRFAGRLRIANSPEQGARTGIYLATSPEVAGVTGGYFLRTRARRSKPITYDASVAARMWTVSERLCGLERAHAREGQTGSIATRR